MVNAVTGHLTPEEGAPVPTVQKAGWTSDSVWTAVEQKKFLDPTGFEPRTAWPVAIPYANSRSPLP